MFSLEALFSHVDDFCQQFEPQWQQHLLSRGMGQRQRERGLCNSEIMTILVAFHQLGYRHFKAFYTHYVSVYWRTAFPGLVSYNRFVEWMPSVLLPLCAYLRSCFGKCSGISFVDATSLKVCHNRRIKGHKVFDGLAARGKTSVDWFFGNKAALGCQSSGRVAQRHADSREHRRP